MSKFSPAIPRRRFVQMLSTLPLVSAVNSAGLALKTFGIAHNSFPVRTRQSQQVTEAGDPVIPVDRFIDLCKSFGGDGCQVSLSQLTSVDEESLKRLRQAAEDKAMFLELSLDGRSIEDLAQLEQVTSIAEQLGIKIARVALDGRRYEEFASVGKWHDFVNHWQERLAQSEPILKQHKLTIGVENHKDWLAEELVEVLKKLSSAYVGACVDFGNNLALLEDPLEVAEKLSPYAVTTHLKDMAIEVSEDQLLLSEVPLGQGILPLAKIMETLRRGRSDIHFCLEMITRDPLKIAYLSDQYWAAYDKRDETRIGRFNSRFLDKASKTPLPKISGMSSQRMLAVEDDNVRRCVAYAKRTLGL